MTRNFVVFTGNGVFGVFATQDIERGEFVLQYKGDRIHEEEAEERELSYKKQQHQHCYQYFFTNNVGQCGKCTVHLVVESFGKLFPSQCDKYLVCY